MVPLRAGIQDSRWCLHRRRICTRYTIPTGNSNYPNFISEYLSCRRHGSFMENYTSSYTWPLPISVKSTAYLEKYSDQNAIVLYIIPIKLRFFPKYLDLFYILYKRHVKRLTLPSCCKFLIYFVLASMRRIFDLYTTFWHKLMSAGLQPLCELHELPTNRSISRYDSLRMESYMIIYAVLQLVQELMLDVPAEVLQYVHSEIKPIDYLYYVQWISRTTYKLSIAWSPFGAVEV